MFSLLCEDFDKEYHLSRCMGLKRFEVTSNKVDESILSLCSDYASLLSAICGCEVAGQPWYIWVGQTLHLICINICLCLISPAQTISYFVKRTPRGAKRLCWVWLATRWRQGTGLVIQKNCFSSRTCQFPTCLRPHKSKLSEKFDLAVPQLW